MVTIFCQLIHEKSRGACQELFAACQVLVHMPTLHFQTANNNFISNPSSKYAPRTLECILPEKKVTQCVHKFAVFCDEISGCKIVVWSLLTMCNKHLKTFWFVSVSNVVRLISTLQYIFVSMSQQNFSSTNDEINKKTESVNYFSKQRKKHHHLSFCKFFVIKDW